MEDPGQPCTAEYRPAITFCGVTVKTRSGHAQRGEKLDTVWPCPASGVKI